MHMEGQFLADLGARLEAQCKINQCPHEDEEAYEGSCFPRRLVGVPVQAQCGLNVLSCGNEGAFPWSSSTGLLPIVSATIIQ